MIYDIIIVGAGISGLYSAYKLLKKNKHLKILILEKNNKNHIGGRMGNINFEGTSVVTGAGIGRKNKDKLLQKLLQELNIPSYEFLAKKDYSEKLKKCNVKENFQLIKKEYKNNIKKYENKTFQEFIINVLGKEQSDSFITCSGYSDYINADIYDTLYNYGFDDNYQDYIGLSIKWKLLIHKLIEKIGNKRIKTNCNVIKITNNLQKYYITTNQNNNKKIYIANKIIIASTIDTVINLLPNYPIYKNIGKNTFTRIYAKISKKCRPIMKKYCPITTIVDTALQKIIPINPDKGIYMIGYNDNNNAVYLQNKMKILKNKDKLKKYFEKLLQKSLNIKDKLYINKIVDVYWSIGTHYYKPLNKKIYKNRQEFIKKAQNPMKNMYVVGEVLALNQGWVEGALNSCYNILKKI